MSIEPRSSAQRCVLFAQPGAMFILGRLSILFLAAAAGSADVSAKEDLFTEAETASLSEDGYQVIARLKSNEAMKAYMQRLLKVLGRQVSDEGGFAGFVPYFSGEIAAQNFDKLRQELLEAPWTTKMETQRHVDVKTGMIISTLLTNGTNAKTFLATRDAPVPTIQVVGTKEVPGSHVAKEFALDTSEENRVLSLAAQKIAVEASKVEMEVAQREADTRRHLATSKASFSKLLAALQQRNTEAKRYNAGLTSDIAKLKEQTKALMKSAQSLQSSNAVLEGALRDLDPQIDAAHKFLMGTLGDTDVTGVAEIQSLAKLGTSRPLTSLLQHAQTVLSEKPQAPLSNKALSLLAIHPAQEALANMSESIDRFGGQHETAMAQLHSSFEALKQDCDTRFAQILEERDELRNTRTELTNLRDDLIRAGDQLKTVHSELHARAVGFQNFTGKVALLADDTLLQEKLIAPPM